MRALGYNAPRAIGMGAQPGTRAWRSAMSTSWPGRFQGYPLNAAVGFRFDVFNAAIGIGDFLAVGIFGGAAYKAYHGDTALRLTLACILIFGAAGPSLDTTRPRKRSPEAASTSSSPSRPGSDHQHSCSAPGCAPTTGPNAPSPGSGARADVAPRIHPATIRPSSATAPAPRLTRRRHVGTASHDSSAPSKLSLAARSWQSDSRARGGTEGAPGDPRQLDSDVRMLQAVWTKNPRCSSTSTASPTVPADVSGNPASAGAVRSTSWSGDRRALCPAT